MIYLDNAATTFPKGIVEEIQRQGLADAGAER